MMFDARACLKTLDTDGCAIVPEAIGPGELLMLREIAEPLLGRKTGRRGGVRDPIGACDALAAMVRAGGIARLMLALGGPDVRVVRSILFDKSADSNWSVSWHQDVTIAAAARVESHEFGPWSMKEGVPHCRPPADLLARMFTVRVHLDDCPRENGPLLTVPGSHRHGFLDDAAVQRCVAEGPVRCCEVRAGDTVVMRPLLLHASEKSSVPRRRRVLHLECASELLPPPLKWGGEVFPRAAEMVA